MFNVYFTAQWVLQCSTSSSVQKCSFILLAFFFSFRSHALGMDIAIFWSVYHPILRQAAEAINKLQPYADKRHSNPTQQSKSENLEESLKNSLQMMYQTVDRPDMINFRNLLWKTMAVFPEKVEAKTRDLVPMVLHFVEWVL